MKTQNNSPQKFKFVTESNLRKNHFEITKWQSAQLRTRLPKGIYWLQLTTGGLIQWNYALLMDYVTNGDRPEHQRLVEEYVESLPKAG